jgi:hypothetical protein
MQADEGGGKGRRKEEAKSEGQAGRERAKRRTARK